MSEQDKLVCQSRHPSGGWEECGNPAVWRFATMSSGPRLLCEECVTWFKAPWMQKRLTRLDAGSAPEIPDNSARNE